MMGGVVHKYFPECCCFEESEMNEILKVAIATPQCQKVIADIKARATNQVLSSPVESEVKPATYPVVKKVLNHAKIPIYYKLDSEMAKKRFVTVNLEYKENPTHQVLPGVSCR